MHRRARHLNAKAAGAGLVLDARRITGLNDGDAVSTWNDVSGNAWNATGTSTERPSYKTAIQGGQPVLRFDGSNNMMSITAVDALNYTKAINSFVIVCVVKDSASSSGDTNHNICTFFAAGASLARAGLFTRLTGTAGILSGARRLDSDSLTVSVSAGTSSNFCVANARFLYSSGVFYASKNSVESSSTALSGSSATSNTTSYGIAIGAIPGRTNRFGGDIGLIFCINSLPARTLLRRLEHSAAFSFKIQCS